MRLLPLEDASELPRGWTDAQGPGRYRLSREGDATFDGWVVGPDSLKQTLFPSREVLYQAERREDGKLGFAPVAPAPSPKAFLGVRACDLAAARVQRSILEGGPHRDARHARRSEDTLVVAVHCTEPGALCFCASTETGPRVTEGADLALAERGEELLVEAHTDAGRAILDALDTREASDADEAWLDDAMVASAGKMGRHMRTEGLPAALFGRLDHPRWDEVADRCLACGNCTSVCPTCFCTTTTDDSDLDGSRGERERLWASCFDEDHAYIHGGTFRPTTKDRYRQWLTHKVGGWVSQTGTSGCVGCGRCIAWCPVGIDLTEEIDALWDGEGSAALPPPRVTPDHAHEDLVPREATIRSVTRESADVVTLRLDAAPAFAPGQFSQLALPGIGEVPISIAGDEGGLEHTIRAVGATTTALCAITAGQQVGFRGPYGRGWPLAELAGAPVVVIAGGIGLAPLRAAIRHMLADRARFPEVHLVYGARTPDDVLYGEELARWEGAGLRLHLTVDQAPPEWTGNVGVVTRLLDRGSVPEGASAMMCGPEIMMVHAAQALGALGVDDAHTWLTMERHMECATGSCGRCQYGPYFVCTDGPVFSLDQVRFLFGRQGF
ncbi:MAG: 4Fe-4S dicluster domain-containing protein [Sandaracinaceae bacterium]